MDHETKKSTRGFEIPAVPAYGMLGQFSYAPATQTTVVTTTTTTTTSFPPFVIKAPRQLEELDPEQYPLALKPTPSIIKKLQFEVNGKSAYFEEAEDTELRLQQLNNQYTSLAAHHGTLRTITNSIGDVDVQKQSSTSSTTRSGKSRQSHEPSRRNLTSITPNSTPESDFSNTPHRQRKAQQAPTWSSRLSRPHPLHQSQESTSGSETCDELEGDLEDDLDNVNIHQPPRKSLHTLRRESAQFRPDPLNATNGSMVRSRSIGRSATPEADAVYQPLSIPRVRRDARRGTLLNTSPVLDASLPSPILSPVTAAANLVIPSLASSTEETQGNSKDIFPVHPPVANLLDFHGLPAQIELPKVHDATFDNSQLPTPRVNDMAGMLDSFEAMPEEMKTYLMYQFLRRCTKPTLKFVASVVDPALKCDFITRLPYELSVNIVRYLDVQSMCRAAQVSKKWRRIVDSDEKAWKDLLDVDGFKPPKGEIQRAVQEGWGWQFPTGAGEWEKDINPQPHRRFDQRLMLDRSGFKEHMDLSFSNSRKRKIKMHNRTVSQKKQKRKVFTIESGISSGWAWLDDSHGPNAFASAAAACLPDPQIGLPSLRNLHLFKSIYARHYLIRKSWMNPETKPLHLAFRAHQRHVVTCLQFDGEKIITGSDDANIDIYDTKTGASVKRLEGHEGGVWALEYEGNLLVSGSTDRTVRIWNIEEGRCLQVWQGHTSTVRCLQIIHPVPVGQNPDGTVLMMPKQPLIITGSRDSSCRVWKLPGLDDPSLFQTIANDAQNPYFVQALTGHHHSVRAIAAHGDTLVSGSYDTTVRVWKISTGETVHRLQGHTSKVYSVVLDHERGRCISGSMDSFVKVWSLDTGSCLLHLEGHTSLVGLLDLKDNYLVSAAADATLRIWDPEVGRCKHVLTGHTGAITCFSHDGGKVVSGSDSTLKMWNTTNGEFVRDLLSDLSGVWQVRFDDRRCIAAVHRNNWTYIEVIDFGAARDGVHESSLGRRIVVDSRGREVLDEEVIPVGDPTQL